MTAFSDAMLAISRQAFADEHEAVKALAELLAPLTPLENAIATRATSLASELRRQGTGHGMESFLNEYGLDTTEGIALMCLAEALLRIPDARTADALIRDKFEGAMWEKHLGGSDSLFVNASSWGLLFTGKVVNFTQTNPEQMLRKLVGKVGEPVIREALKAAMRFIGQQFVMGEDMPDALANAKGPQRRGYRFSYDILGEGARTEAQAQHYIRAYDEAIALLGKHHKAADIFTGDSLSVKLSALHPRYSLLQKDRVMKELLPRLVHLMKNARAAGIMVAIDAEEASRLDIELELFTALLEEPSLAGWNGVGFVVQAYQKRAPYVIDYLATLAKQHKRIIPLRVVKGAYWDSEIKWAQLAGLEDYPVFTRKEHTDISYMACAVKMLDHAECFYPQFATHNARTIASIMELAKARGIARERFEFQRLHGMGEKLHDMVLADAASRIYAPVGEHKDLLAYLIRRLLENGANTSFVHLLMDEDVPLNQLLANPLLMARNHGLSRNPAIALPRDIYRNGWENSRGLDLGNAAHMHTLAQKLAMQSPIASAPDDTPAGTVEPMMKRALQAFPAWSSTPVDARAKALEQAARLIESERESLIHMLMHEAGKTLADAIAEIREAADFCRYYAHQARVLMKDHALPGPTGESNRLGLHPRGVYICISPWNFPLAIFVGQITAALATGNCAIAKPAEQTPRIAKRAVELLHAAGIPRDALQLAIGSGATVGSAFVNHPAIAGVVFTGSVETAQAINRDLASREGPLVPFIAETGGQNCMVVDSSALLEAACDDIILSGFGSAGQRCSALRVLFVQDDIADALIELLKGAIAELRLGDPADMATDIGPVIDEDAHAMLSAHIARMKKEARFIASAPMPADNARHIIAPHLFEIASLAQLPKEIFGPIIHLIRFKAEALPALAAQINATGYGLTFGIHSRIDDHVLLLASSVRAGNCYVNRSMIGATVGVQPFGGEGLSGTGPKAGGPHYLTRFVTERTLSINTAAIGGNLQLLGNNT